MPPIVEPCKPDTKEGVKIVDAHISDYLAVVMGHVEGSFGSTTKLVIDGENSSNHKLIG